MTTLICRNEKRREEVRQRKNLNGLDYLEVGEQIEKQGKKYRKLTVNFLGKAPVSLKPENIIIEGGRRIRDIKVSTEGFLVKKRTPAAFDDYMQLEVSEGDFSTYTLRVVNGKDENGVWQRHPDFDANYDRVDFSFKADCPSDLDCKREAVCPPEMLEEPEINYLAKDYSSFRQLILDRLALILPDWQERHAPDLGITLVELLAYVGDHLSYYQDAVATEAYLDTARQRISVRRHARLVDYPIHEGCNARTWVCVETNNDLTLDPKDTYFITKLDRIGQVTMEHELEQQISGGYEVFEPMPDTEIKLYAGHHELYFYTWDDKECCLTKGATTATLIGEWAEEPMPDKPKECGHHAIEDIIEEPLPEYAPTETSHGEKLYLRPGDVLIFEEVIGPKTGNKSDADPKHRHAVRLTDVQHGYDPLHPDIAITEITWAEDDALPFPLCLSAMGSPDLDCQIINNISVARANLVLVDHGVTVHEDLEPVQEKETLQECDCLEGITEKVIIPEEYKQTLKKGPLTFRHAIAQGTPAQKMLIQDVRQALPQIKLDDKASASDSIWSLKSDLLASGSTDQRFVVEMDNEGHAHLRFSDGELGKRPDAGTRFSAAYRVGIGPTGNVGADTIHHLVSRKTLLSGGIIKIRNPLPAIGGTLPEPLAEVKLYAPHTFRKRLERAITAEDYAAIVKREFPTKVQFAAAQLRWNGSWYEVLVGVDPYGKEEADPALLKEIEDRLYRYRRIGHDLTVKSAQRVPLEISLFVCVFPGYLRGNVKAELLDVFSNRRLPDGRLGFFHPDNLTFGDDIYLSKIIATAKAVTGVENVTVTKFNRFNEEPSGEIDSGLLRLGPLEIARLDNDRSFPENGVLNIEMGGGR